MLNPFGMGNVRAGLGQQGSNQPYNFKGLESRLGKIETGIAGLTDQLNNFQIPGQDTADPIYTGNTTPNPLTTTEPTGGIQSLPEAQEQDTVPPPTGGIQSLPGAQASGQELSRSGPLSLTQKLQNEYLMETKGPLTMGEEWDARAKEMGFDFAEQRRQGHKGSLSSGWDATHQFNKLFEEAGGVLDRPEHGAAARYGEGFTNWLGDKGYQLYTEQEPDYMTQGVTNPLSGTTQDMSWYTPHLSQYAMTAEEMQNPTQTLQARMENLYQPPGNDVGGMGTLPSRFRGAKFDRSWLKGISQQPGIQQNPGQQIQQNPGQQAALQAGIGSLQGPTQQKIKEGYQV